MAKAKPKPKVKEGPSPEEIRRELGKKILELVDKIHEEKKVSKDVVFNGIEAAIRLAAERHFGVEEGVLVQIDHATGEVVARHGEKSLEPVELGRIAAQSAKQVMIQKIREAESDTVFNEYNAKKGELVVGTIQRLDAGTAIVSLGKSEALLPRSEQIPGETHHVGERVKAVIFEVRKTGHRVKIVLSRAHPDFVRSLFEEEIPEVDDRTIDLRAVAREAGYRSKVAVSSIDMKVDCVGACVGVRGSRIKNIIEELNGERIDIVRWNDSLQVLIPNALQPAQISEVFTYPRLGRAIVLVQDDQLSLAIGRRGQNVRLASKLVGMDIEIMTVEELAEGLERAERWFGQLPHVSPEQIQAMIEEGFLSYNELTFIDAAELSSFTGLPEEQADEVLIYAEEYADHMDRAVEEERAEAEAAAQEAAQAEAAAQEAAAQAEASAAEAGSEEVSANSDAADVSVAEPEPAVEVPGHPEMKIASPPGSYHEGPPTDVEGVEEAVIHEEQRTGEDGEQTLSPEGLKPTGDEAPAGATA
jgi:N utilization substance protein A